MKVSAAIIAIDKQIKALERARCDLMKLEQKDIDVDFCMDEGGYTDPMQVLSFDYNVSIDTFEDVNGNEVEILNVNMEVEPSDD